MLYTENQFHLDISEVTSIFDKKPKARRVRKLKICGHRPFVVESASDSERIMQLLDFLEKQCSDLKAVGLLYNPIVILEDDLMPREAQVFASAIPLRLGILLAQFKAPRYSFQVFLYSTLLTKTWHKLLDTPESVSMEQLGDHLAKLLTTTRIGSGESNEDALVKPAAVFLSMLEEGLRLYDHDKERPNEPPEFHGVRLGVQGLVIYFAERRGDVMPLFRKLAKSNDREHVYWLHDLLVRVLRARGILALRVTEHVARDDGL